VICLSLAAMVWLVFGQTRGFEFVNLDDNAAVYLNPQVTKGLSLEGAAWAFTHTEVGNWIPLTVLSHMLDAQLYGAWAGGHHLTNVILHAAASIGLFLVLRAMTNTLWRCAFVAAVFAIHPLRAESVAWVTERKDVLSAVFFILTLAAYLAYVRRPDPWRYGLVAGCMALGLMAKSMLVTVPFLLLLLDYWPLPRSQPVRWLTLEKLPLLGLSGLAAMAAMRANHDAVVSWEALPLSLRLENAAVSAMTYLWQMIRPVCLAAYYPHPKESLPVGHIILAVVVLASISAAAVIWRHRRPWLLVGWLWFLGMLVPVSGIVQTGALAGADRYTYLPGIGVLVALSWGLAELCAFRPWARVALGACAALVLPVLMVTAHAQTAYWSESEVLWRHTLACTGPNSLAHRCLGVALLKKGRQEEALEELKAGVAIWPDADTYYNIGLILHDRGQISVAVEDFRRAVALRPQHIEALNALGLALSGVGQDDEARTCYESALRHDPTHPGVHTNLGQLLEQRGNAREALEHYEQAIKTDPSFVLGLNNLAWILATTPDNALRNGPRALELAERAAHLSNNTDPMVLDTLAAARAENGKFSEAIETANRARSLAAAKNDLALSDAVAARLRWYQTKMPFREASAHRVR
jgi:tetratricopeptide (TPR) repeat protein